MTNVTDTEMLQQRNRELSILNVIAETVNREIDLNHTLQSTLSQVVELFNLHTGWIWLLSEQTGEFYLAAALNLPPALANVPRRMEGWCYCRESYESGEMEGASNIQCSRLKGLVNGTDGLRDHASVPLYAHGKRLGILNVVSGDWRKLSEDELRLLYTVGDMLSIAIERARLFAQSVQLGAVEERNRIAREIHDTLAQGMSATALQLETADALLEADADPAQVRRVVERALRLTRTNLEEARRSVLDLRAAPLEGQTLAEALPRLAREMTAESGLKLNFQISGEQSPLPVRVEVSLYRIAQEAIANVIRHAGATEVTVQLRTTPEQVELTIEDDGHGFDSGAVPKGRFGLIGINERARLLGGAASLCSAPDEGTVLRVVVPVR